MNVSIEIADWKQTKNHNPYVSMEQTLNTIRDKSEWS